MTVAQAATDQRGVVVGLRAVEEHDDLLSGLHLDPRIGECGPLLQSYPGVFRSIRLVQEEAAAAGLDRKSVVEGRGGADAGRGTWRRQNGPGTATDGGLSLR